MDNNKRAGTYWAKLLRDDKINLELFSYNNSLSLSKKKEIFKKYVGIVNLETSTYCNRKCVYCPQYNSQRGERQSYIDEHVYRQILSSLKEINFNQYISLNLYNEPLADNDIFNRISKAKKFLPDAYVLFNSNGDFLTREIIDRLLRVGNNAIYVTLQTNGQYEDTERLRAVKAFISRLGLKYSINHHIPNRSILVDLNYNNMNIKVMTSNWSKYGNYRAGAVKSLQNKTLRQNPCMRPIREITIAQSGKVYLCCNIFPGDKESFRSLAGSVKDDNIFNIYLNNYMVDLRHKLFDFGSKPFPCSFCSDEDNADIASSSRRSEILKKAKSLI